MGFLRGAVMPNGTQRFLKILQVDAAAIFFSLVHFRRWPIVRLLRRGPRGQS